MQLGPRDGRPLQASRRRGGSDRGDPRRLLGRAFALQKAVRTLKLRGGEGNDTLRSGLSGADVLEGGPGDDKLAANNAKYVDTVKGGTGFDSAAIDTRDFAFTDVEQVTRVSVNGAALHAAAAPAASGH